MKVMVVLTILTLVVASAFLYNFVLVEAEETVTEYSDDINSIETSDSDCVDSARVACIPQDGRYNMKNGDVTDKSGNVVSTRSERKLNG